MSGAPDFTTPREAHRAMLDAGAVFAVRRSEATLGFSFTYSVAADGDLRRCQEILAAVKERPPAFFQAFKAHVQGAFAMAKRGAR